MALWQRWYRGDGELTDDSTMFAAALAALNLMGATLSALWLLLPHPGHAHEAAILCATLAAYGLGTFLVLGPRRKPWWMFQASIALDTLIISVALIATGDPGSVYAFSTCGRRSTPSASSTGARSRCRRRGCVSPTAARSR